MTNDISHLLSSYQNNEGKIKDGLVPRTDFRLSMLNPDWFKGRTVLDIGCNNGFFTRYAMKSGATRAVGVDVSNCILGARELAKRENVNAEFWQLNVESKEFRLHCPKFDVIIFFSALAKIKDKDSLLDFLGTRLRYMLLFESNHGEVHKKDIDLIQKHFYFSQLEFLGSSEIPEKPHYMWKGTRSAEYVRYKMIQNIPIEFVPISRIKGWDENSPIDQKGGYGFDSPIHLKLKEDIRNRGIREPIVLQEINGELYGFQGSHRYFIAKELGYKDIPCRVIRGKFFKHLNQ